MTSSRELDGPPSPVSGLTIGRYELVSRIGAGGMGEVFLARSLGAGGFAKDVVIKRILPHLASDPGFVQRFIEEGKLVVRLRHAGIAQVLDMGEEGGVYFIAMEHVEGKDLGELLRVAAAAGRRMPVPLVVHVLVALLDALDYAHHATDADGTPLGVIHRDVSPSNVMIGTSGEVKLLDFGIARAAERLQHSTTGAIRGKYGYMSPQQAAGLELDPRSDLFSVGVIAWELLTGERPFDAPSDLLILDRIRFHDPGRLRDKNPDVPDDLAAVVERLLAKEPDQRFPSAELAARELRAHMLRSAQLPTARDLAAWTQEVLQTLPRALRDRPVQGLSVDELLRLSLGSEPGATASPATPSRVSPRPATVLAAPPSPTPLASPLPEALPAPARTRARFPLLLVGLNLVLIALVILLVLRLGDDDPQPVAAASQGPPDATPSAPDVALASTAPAPADILPTSHADTAPAPDLAEAAPVVRAPSGEVAGDLLASLEGVFAEEVSLTIRTTPPNALVAVNGLGVARAPRTIQARAGTALSGRVSAPDHEARLFEATVGEAPAITIALKPVPHGKLHFRFFPAQGTRVEIDGKPLATTSNVVSAELPVGKHTLALEASDGRRLVRSFAIDPDKTTSLGTLDLGKADTP